jgi:hypothetical protein
MKFAKSVIFRFNNSTTQQFNFDCGSVPGSVSFRIFRTVKNIRVHPAPSVVKNSGIIAVPSGRVPDVSRTGIGRVSDGFDPRDRPVKCGGGRLDGYRGSSIPPPLAASTAERGTGPRDWRPQTSTPRPSTIRSKPESSGASYKNHSGSLREGSRQSGVNRTQPDSTGLNRSHPEFHRQIQILCRARLSQLTLCSVDFLAFLLNPMAFFALYFRQAYKRDNLGVHESNPSYGSRRCEASPAAALKLSKGF